MSPKYDRSAQMMIAMMPDQKEKEVLEIGSGTGILSLHVSQQGARQIVAVDINPQAIENTRLNFEKHNIKNAVVLHSDLFENVMGTFDTIIFNAPFHGNYAEDMLELGTSDFNYQTLKRFFESVGKYLNPCGEILLGFADMGDNELLKAFIQENGFQIESLKTYPNGDWTMYLYTIVKH